jgi:hypothetical protein
MKKHPRLRRFAVSILVLALVLGAVVVIKNFVLGQVRKRIESTFHYSRLRLTVIPPAIVLEDVRSTSASPFFSAEKVSLRISPLSLFKRDRPLMIIIDRPVIRIYENTAGKSGEKLDLRLPFSLENGYVRDGQIFYWSPSLSVRAAGFKAAFRQSKGKFILQASAPETTVLSASLNRPITGRVQMLVEGRGNDLSLHRLTFDGPDVLLKVRGLLTRAPSLRYDLRVGLRAPAERLTEFLKLPFHWAGPLQGEGTIENQTGSFSFQGSVFCPKLVLNGVELGVVEGPLSLHPGVRGSLNLKIMNRLQPPEFVDLDFRPGLVEGRARAFHADSIIRDFKIPWPVRSPVNGNFIVAGGRVRVRAAFNGDPAAAAESGRYPFRGPVDLTWTGRERLLEFNSPKLESSFGSLDVDGRMVIGRDISIRIKAAIEDVRGGRDFTALVLDRPLLFPEIRGRGTAEIKILGDFRRPQVKALFALAPGGFDKFDVAAVDGLTEIAGGEVTGIFSVLDPAMRGEIRLHVRAGVVDVKARLDDGLVEPILRSLDLSLPLQGRASGDMAIMIAGKSVSLKGRLRSEALKAAGLALRNVDTSLEWSSASNELVWTGLQTGLFGGSIEGSGRVNLLDWGYEADIKAAGIDLASFSSGLEGRADFSLAGRGSLSREAPQGPFKIQALRYGKMGPAQASGTVTLSYADEKLTAKLEGRLDPGGSDFSASFSYPEADRYYLLSAKGRLLNPDLFLPWKGVRGEAGFLLEVRGGKAGAQVNGAVDVKGALLPIPGFPHALTDFAGLVFLKNNTASLRSVQGKMAGGEVQGSGEIKFGPGGIESVDIAADGKGMALALLEGMRTLADGSLRLEGTGDRLALSGDFLVKQISWRREFTDRFIFSTSSYREPKQKRTAFDGMALDIRVRAVDNVVVENSLGRIQGRFDLTLTGTVEAPIVLGDIEALRGDVFFQDRKFRVVRARLSFFNPASVEPYLDFRGETFLKDYRVTFSLSGPLDRLRPEFASSPPLPPEDVLALLALGESFKRTYSYDASTQMGTGSLLSFQLAEEAKRRAEKLFALDSFRIDPFVLGASTEMTARLTVGKRISRNIILLYSTNLTSQREDLVRLEWEYSDGFALVVMRDERGRVSLDAKIRKRF